METGRINISDKERVVIAAGFLTLAAMILLRAWVAEDAYITFRVIDNFMNGYGLRWNTGERVQAYTHPLWMLLHIPLFAVWPNLFHVSIALSVVCSSLALLVALAASHRGALGAICFLLLPLGLSKAFLQYSTSGLESPLSFLLLAAFGWIALKKHDHPRFWFYLSLVVTLAMFNRLDAIVFYAPPLLYLMLRHPPRLGQALAGALPLIGWLLFSLWYYGFLFPNTKYAKLDTGMRLADYFEQGLYYAKYLLIWDTASAVILFSVLAFLFFPRWFSGAPKTLPRLPLAMALGVVANCLYIIYVGGDYMAGRFWAVPVFATAWLWYAFAPRRARLDILFSIACVLVAAYFFPPLFGEIRKSCWGCIELKGRVMNAYFIFHSNRLVMRTHPLRLRKMGHYPFGRNGRQLSKEDPPPVKSMWYIGMVGFYAGPKVTIIDELALADPLLAHLPASKHQSFYIGHFRRDIPKGYRHALATGSLEQMAPPLAQYYGKLRLITSGGLWDRERIKTIVLFNLGAYDHWKQEFLRGDKPRKKRR